MSDDCGTMLQDIAIISLLTKGTKNVIIKVTMTLCLAKGYKKTTITNIISERGVLTNGRE